MIYRFDQYELDMACFELRRSGAAVAVEPQVLSLLALLVANPDRMVGKDEIIEKVWNNRIVSEAAVAARIKSVRKAIGDDGQQQRLVRTIHGRGFRFIGKVTSAAHPSASPDGPRDKAHFNQPSIAVLPFQLTGEAGAAGVGAGRDPGDLGPRGVVDHRDVAADPMGQGRFHAEARRRGARQR